MPEQVVPARQPRPVGFADLMVPGEPSAEFAGLRATGLLDVVDLVAEPNALERGGWGGGVGAFEGGLTGDGFADVRPAPPAGSAAGAVWTGPRSVDWTSSLDHHAYIDGVGVI